jgi:hypothetical protein
MDVPLQVPVVGMAAEPFVVLLLTALAAGVIPNAGYPAL